MLKTIAKKTLRYWRPFELIWIFVFCTVAIWITIASDDNLFGFAVFLSGVLCVVLVAKGSILNYPIGIFNTIGYAWLAWLNGLYGEVGLYMLFYLPMMVVGILMWRRHIDAGGIVVMKKLSFKGGLFTMVICVLSTLGLGFVLSQLSGQNTPYIDASTSVLSIVATILMVRRYRDQWTTYIVLNALSIIMWVFRLSSGSAEGALMIVMWSAYLINAFYGFHNWSKGAKLAAGGIDAA